MGLKSKIIWIGQSETRFSFCLDWPIRNMVLLLFALANQKHGFTFVWIGQSETWFYFCLDWPIRNMVLLLSGFADQKHGFTFVWIGSSETWLYFCLDWPIRNMVLLLSELANQKHGFTFVWIGQSETWFYFCLNWPIRNMVLLLSELQVHVFTLTFALNKCFVKHCTETGMRWAPECIIKNSFCYFTTKSHVVGTQKNHLHFLAFNRWIICLFLLLYVPCQQLWSLRDGQLT